MNCWDTGALRNYLAEGTANDAEVTTCIPDYISVCGLDLQSYQIYARCILLDTRTGYGVSISRYPAYLTCSRIISSHRL